MKAQTEPQNAAVKQLRMPCTVAMTSADFVRQVTKSYGAPRRGDEPVRSFATFACTTGSAAQGTVLVEP
jgi:hypothetical protein